MSSPPGSGCTALWWISIVDGDAADRRGLDYQTGAWSENPPLRVTPGTYQLSYYGMLRIFDWDDYHNPQVYARLQRKAD